MAGVLDASISSRSCVRPANVAAVPIRRDVVGDWGGNDRGFGRGHSGETVGGVNVNAGLSPRAAGMNAKAWFEQGSCRLKGVRIVTPRTREYAECDRKGAVARDPKFEVCGEPECRDGQTPRLAADQSFSRTTARPC